MQFLFVIRRTFLFLLVFFAMGQCAPSVTTRDHFLGSRQGRDIGCKYYQHYIRSVLRIGAYGIRSTYAYIRTLIGSSLQDACNSPAVFKRAAN